MDTKSITVRVNEQNKNEASKILEGLGLNMTTAINMFIAQVVMRRAIPFEVAEPRYSIDTMEAIAEVDSYCAGRIDLPKFDTIAALKEDLES